MSFRGVDIALLPRRKSAMTAESCSEGLLVTIVQCSTVVEQLLHELDHMRRGVMPAEPMTSSIHSARVSINRR